MGLAGRGLVAGAAVAGGVLVGRAVMSRLRGGLAAWHGAVNQTPADGRWHAVTVNRPVEKVMSDGRLPEPLAVLGDAIEVQMRPAPAGKGTELLVKARNADVRVVRRALREARSLVETGEVLRPDAPPTTEPTRLNAPLRYATAHGREEGLL